jgi:hypothetical protein
VQRQAQLNVLVHDAEAVLELALEQSDDPDVRLVGWLLTKVLGDDVEKDESGVAYIAQGTAEDRTVSMTDPQMRHGRKSSSHRFDGFKASVSIDQDSELILDIDDLAANAGDGQALMPGVERVEDHADVQVERVIGDTAEFKALYNPRSAVERIIRELVRHGLRRTRYIGERKRHLQRLWIAEAVNLKRLFTLAQARHRDLRIAVAAIA